MKKEIRSFMKIVLINLAITATIFLTVAMNTKIYTHDKTVYIVPFEQTFSFDSQKIDSEGNILEAPEPTPKPKVNIKQISIK